MCGICGSDYEENQDYSLEHALQSNSSQLAQDEEVHSYREKRVWKWCSANIVYPSQELDKL